MSALDRTDRQPLWAQLHADLLRRLSAGEFEGSFPGESHLRDEYGVSRHTVREALRRIRDAGLIESGRGRQSHVLATTIEQPLGSLYSLFREVEARGMTQESVVLACTLATEPRAATKLELPPDTEMFALERLRLADGQPLAHDCVWLPAAIGSPLLGTDFTRTALYDELARHDRPRPDGGRERITAAALDPEMGEHLQVTLPAAALVIERTGLLDGRPIECRRTTVRSDRYALLVAWSEHGYRVSGDAD